MASRDTWDLSVLYSGPDDPRLQADTCAALAVSGSALSYVSSLAPEALTPDVCREALARINAAMLLAGKTGVYYRMLFLTDSARHDALQALENLGRADTENAEAVHALSALIGQSGMAEILAASPMLAGYEAFVWRIQRDLPHLMPRAVEEAVRRMQLTGGLAWSRLRGQAEAGMAAELELDGALTAMSVTGVRALLSHSDPAVRRRAQQADIQAGRASGTVFAACLNGIKGEALAISSYQRFPGVLDWMLFQNRMERATLDALLSAVRDALPVFQGFLKAKARLLGCDGGLYYCDIGVPAGKGRRYTLGQARSLITKAFAAVDARMGAFADTAFAHRWIDSKPRAGRQGGAMCLPLHTAEESRIFVNFDGSLSGVIALAHELGHAWHDRCLSGLPILMRDAPTPVCETASAFAETLLYEYLLKGANAKDRLHCLDAVLAGGALLVNDIYSRYLFEDELFRRRAGGGLDADTLCGLMLESQRAAYGCSLCPEGMHPYMWVDKVHYYIPDFHYYSFPYTFGLLFARALYGDFIRRPEGFPARYSELLSRACAMSTEEAGAWAGLDITQKGFWTQALRGYESMAEEYCRLAGE